VKTWRTRHADTASAGIFAVHRQLKAFALTELIADVGAYNSLSATSRLWLERLPPDAHLTRDLQREFHAQTPGSIRYLGTVNQPLAADIYAIDTDPLSVATTTDVVAPHIETAWQRYCRWLAVHAAPCLPDLNPAASDVALAHARAGFMQALPPELAALYLQHNGPSPEGIACFPDGHWLPLNEAVKIWQQCRREIPQVWQAEWVPLAYSDGHAYIVVDARGEVLDVYLEDNTVALVAPSLAAWLDALAAQADRGGLAFDPVNQTLIVPESAVR